MLNIYDIYWHVNDEKQRIHSCRRYTCAYSGGMNAVEADTAVTPCLPDIYIIISDVYIIFFFFASFWCAKQ